MQESLEREWMDGWVSRKDPAFWASARCIGHMIALYRCAGLTLNKDIAPKRTPFTWKS